MRSESEIGKELEYRTGYLDALNERDLDDEYMNGYKAALEWVLEDEDEDEQNKN